MTTRQAAENAIKYIDRRSRDKSSATELLFTHFKLRIYLHRHNIYLIWGQCDPQIRNRKIQEQTNFVSIFMTLSNLGLPACSL